MIHDESQVEASAGDVASTSSSSNSSNSAPGAAASGASSHRSQRKMRLNKSKNGATSRSTRSTAARNGALKDGGGGGSEGGGGSDDSTAGGSSDIGSDDDGGGGGGDDSLADEDGGGGMDLSWEGCDLSAAVLRKIPRLTAGGGLSPAEGEIVRLIGQYLRNIGLRNSAAVLMTEAGCQLDHTIAATFRKHVMNGEWSSAVTST